MTIRPTDFVFLDERVYRTEIDRVPVTVRPMYRGMVMELGDRVVHARVPTLTKACEILNGLLASTPAIQYLGNRGMEIVVTL